MKRINMCDGLLEKLHQIIPHNPTLTSTVSEILVIEKEAVYRRLRREVPFTLEEAALLADKLKFSLDGILRQSSSSSASNMLLLEISPHDSLGDFRCGPLERFAKMLDNVADDPPSERGEALTSLPVWVCSGFPVLERFLVFRWAHQHEATHSRFDSVSLETDYFGLVGQLREKLERISSTYYIWNMDLIPGLVREIRYFRSIDLITAADVESIKGELIEFLDYLKAMAQLGQMPGSGNRFELYVASLNTVNTYSYMVSNSLGVAVIPMFIIQACGSGNADLYNYIRDWVGSLKSSSILISGSAEQQRVLFFRRARQAVISLDEEEKRSAE